MIDKRFGVFIKDLRKRRGLSQRQLATVAQIAVRTLAYWESGERIPRSAELDSALLALHAAPHEKALAASLVAPPRGTRLVRRDTRQDDLLVAPGVGDLLRALRLRVGWSQTRLATELKVNRSTVLRWETTTMFPSDVSVDMACDLLGAYPEEREALQSRRLQPPTWPMEIPVEECEERVMRLGMDIDCLQTPVVDLYALTLERHLRMHALESPEAFRVLAKLHADHARWLVMQDRYAESALVCRQALALMEEPHKCEAHWLTALNIASIHVGLGQRGERTSLKLLGSWLPRITQPQYRSTLVCDIAYYAARCGRAEQSEAALKQAHDLVKMCEDNGHELERYYRLSRMRVLTINGKPAEALEELPSMPPARSHRIFSLIAMSETMIAAGEKCAAQNHLAHAQCMLQESPAPRYRALMESAARNL